MFSAIQAGLLLSLANSCQLMLVNNSADTLNAANFPSFIQACWNKGLSTLSLGGLAPAYLADDCRLLSDIGHRPLRSNSNNIRKLLVPRTHNELGDRSFSAAGPRLWNDLPPGLRRPGLTFDSFRQSLKTHLFGDLSGLVTLLNL